MTLLFRRIAQHCLISIHIPRVGDDPKYKPDGGEYPISIHIPRVGDDK